MFIATSNLDNEPLAELQVVEDATLHSRPVAFGIADDARGADGTRYAIKVKVGGKRKSLQSFNSSLFD